MRLSGRMICADADQADAIRRNVQRHIQLSRAEPGCLSFEVWQTAGPLVWRVEERFASAVAFEAHQRRTRASDWWAATAGIVRAYAVEKG